MDMKKFWPLLVLIFIFSGCHKHSDDPAVPAASSGGTLPPPGPSGCYGFTVTYSYGSNISAGYNQVVQIPHFDVGCGDSVKVFLRPADHSQPFVELAKTPGTKINYYTLVADTVTVYNNSTLLQEVDIEAVLK